MDPKVPIAPRQTIFISHGRPEEDGLTRWLCGRLTARGFKVWADLEQLHGGDPFWADIERTIRTESVRFLILVTRTSVTKKGVLDELAEATDVAKSLNDDRFIIPLKGDDLPWHEFPIQLKRLNGLDFSSDWLKGLSELLETLEAGGVPRLTGDPEISRVATLLTTSRHQIKPRSEGALLNWLVVKDLPGEINYFHTSYSAKDLAASRDRISIPHAPQDRLILTFADVDALRGAVPADMEIEPRYSMPFEEFLSGTPKHGPRMQPYIARNLLTEIIRQAFETRLRKQGLVQFDRRWFVPSDWCVENKARYLKPGGDVGYRVLVGKSKELTWHFAVSVWVHASEPRRIQLIPHVLFSPDSAKPLADQKSLRRSRCKLWWNDKWRDLLQAFLGELFGRELDTAPIDLGGEATMTLQARLLLVQLAASYSEDNAYVPDTEDEEATWGDPDVEEVIA
jgi:hypothetical protein